MKKGKTLSVVLALLMVMALMQPASINVYGDEQIITPVYDVGNGNIRITTSGGHIYVEQGSSTPQAVSTLKITGNSTSSNVTVGQNVNGIQIIFENLNIDRSSSTEAAVTVEAGAKADIRLAGKNYVYGGTKQPGIRVDGNTSDDPTSLSIAGFDSLSSLAVTGGAGAPGIGNTQVDGNMYASINIESGNVTATGGTDVLTAGNTIAAPAIGSTTTATSIKIGLSSNLKAYSTGTVPAVHGTKASDAQAILNMSFDANDSYTVSKLTTQTAIRMPADSSDASKTIEGIVLPTGYRGFAVNADSANSYYAEASIGTPAAIKYNIVSAVDGAWSFNSQSDGSYTTSAAIKFYRSGGGGSSGSSSNKPVLNKKDHVKYMDVYSNSYFKPDQAITRGEVAGAFARLMDKPINTKKTYKNSFSDVDSDYIYSNHIGFLEQYDILKGYPDGTFRPDSPISRAEFAAVASRFDKLEETDKNVFSDIGEDNMWAVKAINSAYKKGWIDGYPNGKFKPNNDITRAEVTKIVSGMLDRTINADSIKGQKVTKFKDLDDEHWAYYYIIEATHDHEYTITNKKEIWSK